MTIFITEFFKLDLTHLTVKFSEENSFFEKDLIKQQSFPFNVPYERSYIPFYDFVSSHNSQNANKYIKGVLFRNDKYFEAELLIISVSKTIKSVIYYSFDKLTIFDTKLSDLPWSTINVGTSIFDFANVVKLQNYPDTKINFVQIHDPEKYADYEFGSKVDFINYHESTEGFSEYVPNPLNLPFRFFKMNEMRPFIYIKEIIQFIFEQINYTVSGNFLEDSKISKALQYHNNAIFYTNNDYHFEDELNLTLNQSIVSGYSPTTTAYNEYIVTKIISQKGSYKVILELEGELSLSDYGNFYLKCYFNNQIISGGTAGANYNPDGSQYTFNRSLEFKFDVPEDAVGSTLEFRFICNPFIKETIEGNYEVTGTLRPLYSDSINLKDLLPDQTVGEYINAIKESFVLRTNFNTNTKNVIFSFFNSDDGDQEIIDISKYEVFQTPRQLNLSVGYKVQFNDDTAININKKGEFVTADEGFTIINLPIEPLPSIYIETQPYVKHQDALALFFYEANENARPLLIDDNENSYNRLGFVHQFQRQWLYQNLNSEEYNLNVDLPLYISSKINAKSKLWFYNNFFIVHNLKRFSKNNFFEKMNFRLFKLKSYPQFNFVIDGGTDFEPPTAFTSNSSFGLLVTEFSTTITPGQLGNPSYFTIDIFGNQSSDPQSLPLSFGWEIISTPDGNNSVMFQSQNTAHSITRFQSTSYLITEGDYYLKLKVTNSAGLSDEILIKVAVSSTAPTPPKIILNKIPDTDNSEFTERFGISFDNYSTTSVNVIIQKFDISTQSNIGGEINYGVITDFTLPHHDVTFPSYATWKLRVESTDEVSNEIAWFSLL